MTGWDFASPLALALAPAPLLAAWARPSRRSAPSGLLVPSTLRDRFAARGGASRYAPRALALAWLAWLCVLVALAGPRMAAATPPLLASGRDIMLALDLSGSMTKTDFLLDGASASRLDALKRVGSELIRRRAGDRIGLVIFAENAFAAAPLSFDVAAVSQTLKEMEIGLVGRSTAIGEGLGLALKRLADSTAPTRVIILLSDGAGEGVDAAAAREATRLGAEGHALHTLFIAGDSPDAPRRRAALSGLAAAGRGLAGDAAQPEDIVARISSRAIAHVAGSALQTLGWRDCGQLVLIFAAASLLLCFRRSAP